MNEEVRNSLFAVCAVRKHFGGQHGGAGWERAGCPYAPSIAQMRTVHVKREDAVARGFDGKPLGPPAGRVVAVVS
jgi:hypothetical protein